MAPIIKKKVWNFGKEKDKVKDKEPDMSEVIVCPSCKRELAKAQVVENKYVCYKCGNYFRVRTFNRIKMVADTKSFVPWFHEMDSKNPASRNFILLFRRSQDAGRNYFFNADGENICGVKETF